MKTEILKRISIPVLAMGLMVSCINDDLPPGGDVKPIVIPEKIAKGSGEFAFDFFKNLQASQPATDNLFVSPLSLHMAMGMLLNGADGQTATEIKNSLKMEEVTLKDLNQTYYTLLRDLPNADGSVKLGLANSMWHKQAFQVKADYSSTLKQVFKADVTGLPFDATAVGKINQWASDKTNKKIEKVLDTIEPDQVMFLLNALYFKGSWQSRFETKNTADTPFNKEDGTSSPLKMMFQEGTYKATSNDSYKALQLPYGKGQFNMTIILPNGGRKIGEVMNEMTFAKWEALQNSGLKATKVKVGLPKFTLKRSVNLNSTLKQMGIQKVFQELADLSKINDTDPLKVSFVKQDAYLGLDEEGTEAAAVTTIGVVLTSVDPNTMQFICNQPFGLVISEKTSNTILFMGRIMNPAATQ
ncbi:serpin family protein [Dyadobacter tibetensis]|uniref:serpin family protein n=1 Tax=Dyadobacter tibetensis TaxID=1211851 RepID=UPI0005C4A646|nr:serpin family protein [Dyadobacter tibetensis]